MTANGTANIYLTGIVAPGIIGQVLVWGQIPDDQNPNWTNIDDSGTDGWTAIDDSETANWELIAA